MPVVVMRAHNARFACTVFATATRAVCYTHHASPAQLVVCCLCTCVDLSLPSPSLFDHLQFDYSYKIRLHLVAHLASFTTSG
jgi:hypothetical protein